MKAKLYFWFAIPALLALAFGLAINPQAKADVFIPAGPMSTNRYFHAATLLTNGQVLVAGGADASGSLSSADLYDPTSGTWTNTGTMNIPRQKHTATLLPNGKVLVAGGVASHGVVSSAELYDPGTGDWTPTGSLNVARSGHIATLLTNGLVLVAGGDNSSEFVETLRSRTGV